MQAVLQLPNRHHSLALVNSALGMQGLWQGTVEGAQKLCALHQIDNKNVIEDLWAHLGEVKHPTVHCLIKHTQ